MENKTLSLKNLIDKIGTQESRNQSETGWRNGTELKVGMNKEPRSFLILLHFFKTFMYWIMQNKKLRDCTPMMTSGEIGGEGVIIKE